MFTDINISDVTIRNQFIQYWKQGNFASAYALLSNANLQATPTKASYFNQVCSDIVTLEENDDPSFRQYVIQTSATAPSGLTTGQIYFKVV